MDRIKIVIISLLLFSCNNVESKLEKISDYYKKGKFEKVIEMSTELINEHNNLVARKYRGKAYSKIGENKSAFLDYYYLNSIIGDSTSELLEELALVNLELGDFDRSLLLFEKLLLRDNQNPAYYYYVAIILNNQSQYVNAIKYLNTALRFDSSNVEYLKLKANAYNSLYKFREAINCYNLLMSLGEKNEFIYYNRGISFLDNGNYDSAILDLSKVISMNNKSSDAYYNRGLAYTFLGDKINACKDLNQSILLNKLDIEEGFRDYCNQ